MSRGRDKSQASLLGPDIGIKLSSTHDKLKKDGRFLCSVRFINDLPEIPCDPKMLLPPLNPQELAAFKLTTIEKETKHNLLFQPDLGISLTPLDIERYSVTGSAAALDPQDAALLSTTNDAAGVNDLPGGFTRRARPRGEAAEASWLLRTKYITNEMVEAGKRISTGGGVGGVGTPLGTIGGAAAAKQQDEPLPGMTKEEQIEAIEKTFQDAEKPPVHHRNPKLVATEIFPVLPDEFLEGWSCVLAAFDGSPTDDVERLAQLPTDQRQRCAQAAQLKSFSRRKADGSSEKFAAFMLPREPPPAATEEESRNGAVAIAAAGLQGDYDWIREYNTDVRYDETTENFLFRFGKDYVGYRDLDTRLTLRKRKRQLSADDIPFTQPEKFIIVLPGVDEEGADDDEEQQRREEQQQQQEQEQENGGSDVDMQDAEVGTKDDGTGEGGTTNDAAAAAAIMRDVFGSEDEDD